MIAFFYRLLSLYAARLSLSYTRIAAQHDAAFEDAKARNDLSDMGEFGFRHFYARQNSQKWAERCLRWSQLGARK
jgi:hypothetical protein